PGPDPDPWSEQAARAFTAFSEMENLEDRLRTDGRTDRQVLAYFREKLSKSPPLPTKAQGRGSA
ncbi:MAG TPA: putative peptidoglycan binding domain-containing protein, partial [Candidatus Dormibacteraeota bacterium]|nr:putative peptidoglycan binding domain-containing protein [Candidatus Dormibacteraeota bacterium]